MATAPASSAPTTAPAQPQSVYQQGYTFGQAAFQQWYGPGGGYQQGSTGQYAITHTEGAQDCQAEMSDPSNLSSNYPSATQYPPNTQPQEGQFLSGCEAGWWAENETQTGGPSS
jgi:hypothetical protein